MRMLDLKALKNYQIVLESAKNVELRELAEKEIKQLKSYCGTKCFLVFSVNHFYSNYILHNAISHDKLLKLVYAFLL